LRIGVVHDEMRIQEMSNQAIRPVLRRSIEVFRNNWLLFLVPIFIIAFAELWSNIGFSHLRHSLTVSFWRHYWVGLRNPKLATLEVVPLGIAIQISIWFVQFYLWAFAFAAIAVLVLAQTQQYGITMSRAYFRALSLDGLPALLWRMFWRLAIAGYSATVVLGLLGYVLFKFFPSVWHASFAGTSGQSIITGFGLLIFIPFFMYAYQFSLAIPCLAYQPGNAYTALADSIHRSRFWGWKIWLACYGVAVVSGEIDRLLPAYVYSLSTLPLPSLTKTLIATMISSATGLLWAWLFVFLTLLAIAETPVQPEVVPEAIHPASM
jgi:hypothetical protein